MRLSRRRKKFSGGKCEIKNARCEIKKYEMRDKKCEMQDKKCEIKMRDKKCEMRDRKIRDVRSQNTRLHSMVTQSVYICRSLFGHSTFFVASDRVMAKFYRS